MAMHLVDANRNAAGELSAAISRSVLPGRLSFRTAPQQASPGRFAIRAMANGGKFAAIQSDAVADVRHDAHDVSQLREDALIAWVVHAGSGAVAQHDVSLRFGPGDIVIRQARAPSQASFDGPLSISLFWIRSATLTMGSVASLRPRLHRLSGDTPLGTAIRCTASALDFSIASSNSMATHAIENGLTQLLIGAMASTPSASLSPQEQLTERLLQFIEANLDDPDLCAQRCSTEFGISERYFFRLLEVRGIRYRSHVMQRRLQLVQEAMARAVDHRPNVSAIAFRHGFNNAAHFSSAFKARYGMTPSQYLESLKSPR